MNDFVNEEAAMPYSPDDDAASAGASSAVERVRQSHERQLMSISGVEGVGIGRSKIGGDAIIVYLRDEGTKKLVPRSIGGYPVETIVTGTIDAY